LKEIRRLPRAVSVAGIASASAKANPVESQIYYDLFNGRPEMFMNKQLLHPSLGPARRFCGVLACILGASVTLGWAADLQLASAPSSSFIPPTTGDNDSCFPIISRDGRYVLFGSTAENLAVRPGNLPYRSQYPIERNVFLFDRIQGTLTLVSIDVTGTTGGSGHSTPTGISTNDQFVLFESQATNLVAGGSNPAGDVFRRDLLAQITTLVSASTNSGPANGASTDSTMTPDGRYVAFSSLASNLVPGDTNGISDVFVRDTQLGSTVLVSVGAQATPLIAKYHFNNAYSGASGSDLPEITPDGRFVAFLSTATNLVAGGTNPGEIYVRDLANNLTYCVSTNADQYFTNLACFSHRISADGQFVAFEAISVTSAKPGLFLRHNLQTGAEDFVSTNAALPGDYYQNVQSLDMTPDGRFIAFVSNTNSGSSSSIMVWDAQTATTTTVCQGAAGAVCDSPQIDPTGRYVSFRSTAANVVTNAVSPGSQHLYLCDLQAGTTQLVDIATNGAGSAGLFVSSQSMDATARYVAFDATGADLVTNDSNGAADVFVRDTIAGATQLVSAHHPLLASQTSVPAGFSSRYNISADGRYLAFAGNGSGLAPAYTNRFRGIFVRDLMAQTNLLVSVSTNGIGDANGWSTDPMISGNGRFVAFTSWAANLVKNDTNRGSCVFVRDLQTGTTSLVSVDAPTIAIYGYTPRFSAIAISFDGRYILFSETGELGFYLRDTTAGVTYTLPSAYGWSAANMTPDGHYIAYCGYPSPDPLGGLSLYVWDSQAAQLVYTNSNYYIRAPLAISTNGQRLAYVGSGIHLVDWPTNNDQVIGVSRWESLQSQLSFSGDGRYLTYCSQGQTRRASPTDAKMSIFMIPRSVPTNW
jgi:Tol biopolymer transport system component